MYIKSDQVHQQGIVRCSSVWVDLDDLIVASLGRRDRLVTGLKSRAECSARGSRKNLKRE